MERSDSPPHWWGGGGGGGGAARGIFDKKIGYRGNIVLGKYCNENNFNFIAAL